MSGVKMGTLVGAAGVLGMGIGVITLFLRRERDSLANKALFLTQAVEMMKEQDVCKQLLGEDVEIGRASLHDGFSKLDRDHVQIRIPIKGQNDTAHLYAYARRKTEQERLRLYKLEAKFEKIPGKRLLLLDRTDKEDDEVERKREDEELKRQQDPEVLRQKRIEAGKKLAEDQMRNWKWNK